MTDYENKQDRAEAGMAFAQGYYYPLGRRPRQEADDRRRLRTTDRAEMKMAIVYKELVAAIPRQVSHLCQEADNN